MFFPLSLYLSRCRHTVNVGALVAKIDHAVGGLTCEAVATITTVGNDAADAIGAIVNNINLKVIQGTGNAVASIDLSSLNRKHMKP